METQTTQTPPAPCVEHTPIERAAHELATQLLQREADKIGRPVLEGDEHAGQVLAWIDHVSEKIITVTGLIDFPELPVAKREQLGAEEVLGDFRPTQIDFSDAESAVERLNEAESVDSLSEDEADLRDSLVRLMQAMESAGGDAPALLRGYEDDFLNDRIPHDLPDWLNEHIDWERIYAAIIRGGEQVELPFGDYTVLGIYA